MSELDYTYAVARVRALETTLLSAADIDRLIACQNERQCLQFLAEKGWGKTGQEPGVILARETEKTWEIIRELSVDMGVIEVLDYPNRFHNLKAAIKEACTQETNASIFYKGSGIPPEELTRLVKDRAFDKLPSNMAAAAAEAYEVMLHTRDGQFCDLIVDKACLEAIYQKGQTAEDPIIRAYAETTVAVADIKIAVRAQRTGKSIEFMQRAMAPCRSLNVDLLARAALSSFEAVREYLSGTEYAEGAEALGESASAFERWCDNRIIRLIQPQKYNAFSAGPLFAYILARENEIKTVRIILTGKQNNLPDGFIRERVREMYV